MSPASSVGAWSSAVAARLGRGMSKGGGGGGGRVSWQGPSKLAKTVSDVD